MAFLIYLLFYVVAATSITSSNRYKALVVNQMPSKSHANLNDAMIKRLLQDGYEVTYIRSIAYDNAPPTLRQIDIGNINAIPSVTVNIQALMNNSVQGNDRKYVKNYIVDASIGLLENKDVQELLSDPNEHFDVVIVNFIFSDLHAGLATIYECPLVWMSSLEVNSDILSNVDENPNPLYVYDLLSSNVKPFSFQQRVRELWNLVYSHFLSFWYFDDLQIQAYNRLIAPLIIKRGRVPPAFHEIRYNASLVLGYSHVSMGEAVSLPQIYKPVGGFHIDEDTIKPLPKDLKKILDDAKHGVIYFSMGSNLKGSGWPTEITRKMVEMFGQLNQTVLWKFEETLPNSFGNLYIWKWFPQLSILSHPNCILFITQGGILSTAEALYAGVPIIGIPGFADQFLNVKRVTNKGLGLQVDMSYNVIEDLKQAIGKITSDPTYHRKAKEWSFIFHDRPVKPIDELSFWVRHVIQTRGAKHLRSLALNMPLYQRLFLDVAAVLFIVVMLSFLFLKYACTVMMKIMLRKKEKKC